MVATLSSSDFARLGDLALGAGHRSEAISHYESALAIDPTDANIWYNLGWAMRAERQFDGALDAYSKALAGGVHRPEEVLLNRAAVLADHLYQPDAAVADLTQALEMAPQFVPAMLNLGTLHEDRGHADAARNAYQAALAQFPGLGRAHARLAMIDLAEGQIVRALTAIGTAEQKAASAEDMAEILYAKATLLDADGNFDMAFKTLGRANELARAVTPTRYDADVHAQLVTRLIDVFQSPIMFAAHNRPQAPKPVFIVGMFRSGSTLTEQYLARHSAITSGGELEFIPATAQSTLVPYPESLISLDAARVDAVRSAYINEMRRVSPTGWTTDKRCDNVMHLGLIKMLFPEAPVIHTVRDPLDTILSVLFLHFGDGVPYGSDQRDAAHYFIQYRRLMAHWHSIFPDMIVDVDYDRLVRGASTEIAPVFHKLGLPAEEFALGAVVKDEAIRTASSWQVRKPLHQKSSGRWRNYARHLEPARTMLQEAGLID